LVGRAPELDELGRVLDGARAGHGRTVLLVGEAGIGKSRLASELARRAGAAGFEVLVGRSIDLVGTELPYQPFVDALRRIGEVVDDREAGSQLRLFEHMLAVLGRHATEAPVLLELEDVHWADVSTLDLIVFLAHNIGDRSLVLVSTLRSDDPPSAVRMRRLTDGVRRSGSGVIVELGPLAGDQLEQLVAARLGAPASTTLAHRISVRSEGNPFFAEELAAAALRSRNDELPRHLRDVLLQRVVDLDQRTQQLLRLAAAAGRDVAYPLLLTAAGVPDRQVRTSLRRAVEHGVLVGDPATGTFRFRHALLADAVYATVLPGEREELHERLAEALARDGPANPAELAPHWAAAGRPKEALVASVAAAQQAEAAFAVPEALAHLERALTVWPSVPDAADVLQVDLAALCARAAELASRAGAAPRAVELAQRAIQLVDSRDRLRVARLYDSLGRYLHESGRTDAALAALERVVELVPAEQASVARAEALAALARGLMLAWRFDESLPICEQALGLARAVGTAAVEMWALLELGCNLAYLGRGEEGLGYLEGALELARGSDDPTALVEAYVSVTDVLTMLGRPRQAAAVGDRGLDDVRRYGVDSTVLVANHIEALLAIGEWDQAATASAAALRAVTANFPYMLYMLGADLELGRGDFEAAREHLDAALGSLREDRGQGVYDVYLAELALWERRWTDAEQAAQDGLTRARSRQAAQLRVWFCAKGLRADAELAALAHARRDALAARSWLARARRLMAVARRAAAEASAVTPNAGGWLAIAEAEYQRARGLVQPTSWTHAAAAWDRLERPPLAAYCRWREAEALVAAGATRTETMVPLRQAYTVAATIGAAPLQRELELLAQRARLDLTPPDDGPRARPDALEHVLGLTPREAEVLRLVARGDTNREIAATLFISVKTASVHVSHILSKLGVTKRTDAATIAHRLAPPSPPAVHRRRED
jgi:DNA-binding CsgD family transcriptional regulator/tetratricopeptide (TPR) repeat protein